MIKVKGFQVAPAELEGCLLSIREVADACVVPVPDDYCVEVPMAFVVLHDHVAKRVADDPHEADRVKTSITKVRTDVARGWFDGDVDGTPVCGRQQGGVQAARGRRRVYRCDSEESEREASSTCIAGPRSGDEGKGKG